MDAASVYQCESGSILMEGAWPRQVEDKDFLSIQDISWPDIQPLKYTNALIILAQYVYCVVSKK